MNNATPGWLLTNQGSWDFVRVYWMVKRDETEPSYVVKDNGPRVGLGTLEHIALDSLGATVKWSTGHRSWIPATWYQFSYKPKY